MSGRPDWGVIWLGRQEPRIRGPAPSACVTVTGACCREAGGRHLCQPQGAVFPCPVRAPGPGSVRTEAGTLPPGLSCLTGLLPASGLLLASSLHTQSLSSGLRVSRPGPQRDSGMSGTVLSKQRALLAQRGDEESRTGPAPEHGSASSKAARGSRGTLVLAGPCRGLGGGRWVCPPEGRCAERQSLGSPPERCAPHRPSSCPWAALARQGLGGRDPAEVAPSRSSVIGQMRGTGASEGPRCSADH